MAATITDLANQTLADLKAAFADLGKMLSGTGAIASGNPAGAIVAGAGAAQAATDAPLLYDAAGDLIPAVAGAIVAPLQTGLNWLIVGVIAFLLYKMAQVYGDLRK